MGTEAQLIEMRAQIAQMKAQMAESAAAMASMRGMPMLEETACYGLASLDVDDGCFIVRHCRGASGEEDGQWEIFLPPGCCSVGSSCGAMNKKASEKAGHGDEENWYRLDLTESEGTTLSRQDGNGGTTSYRQWEIVVHAKTSAGIYGADGIDESKRYMYVSAVPYFSGENAESKTKERRNSLGDEFSRTVATAYVETIDGETVRRVEQVTSNAINVAAATAGNFRLVWWFEVKSSGLEVKKVYCVSNTLSAAGMVLKGDNMVDVSGFAEFETLQGNQRHWIYARIRTNEENLSENIVEVVMDASPRYDDDFTIWLGLYEMNRFGNVTDSRSSSLTNVQIYR